MYDRIVAADSDKTGTISQGKLFDLIHAMSNEGMDAAKDGIPIAAFNPDMDGDGKIQPWEAAVFRRIQEADADKSGKISVSELYLVIKGAAESDKQKRLFARLLGGAVFIILLLIGAMLGMGIVAGEAVKESHVTGASAMMTSTDGRTVVQTDTVETGVGIFDVPLVLLDPKFGPVHVLLALLLPLAAHLVAGNVSARDVAEI